MCRWKEVGWDEAGYAQQRHACGPGSRGKGVRQWQAGFMKGSQAAPSGKG
jgi:hypothetical protein